MNTNNSNKENTKTEIKLNRKMRLWNRYKTYIIGGVSVLVILGVGTGVVKLTTGSKKNPQDSQTASVEDTHATEATTAQQTTQAQSTQAATEATTAAPAVKTAKLEGSAAGQEYTSKDFYASSMFLGDSVMEGVSYYGYVPSTQVISNGNMTTDKAVGYINEVASANPAKVFIMVGLNDCNYDTRTVDDMMEYYSQMVSGIKKSHPDTQVYLLSVLPVTKGFEAKTTTKIKQSVIEEINTAMAQKAASMNASYIDVASAFKDGTGYMNPEYTSNGYNLKNEYYPFLLNGIAGVAK